MDRETKQQIDMIGRTLNCHQTTIMQIGDDFMKLRMDCAGTLKTARDLMEQQMIITKDFKEMVELLTQNQDLMMKELVELKEKIPQTPLKEK